MLISSLQAFQLAVALARDNSVLISGDFRDLSGGIKLTIDDLRKAFNVRKDYNNEIREISDTEASALAHERGELAKRMPDKSVPDAEDDPVKPEPGD